MLRLSRSATQTAHAGVTLIEALIVIGILLSGISLAAHSLTWLRVLIQPPNPAGASAAIQLVKDLSGASSVTSDQACGLLIDGDLTYRISPGHFLTRSRNGLSRTYPGVACVGYADNILRVFSDRAPGSCRMSPDAATQTITASLHQHCEYEEQAVTSHRWN